MAALDDGRLALSIDGGATWTVDTALDAPSTREMELVHGRRADGAGMGHLGGGGGGFRPPPPEEDSDEEML